MLCTTHAPETQEALSWRHKAGASLQARFGVQACKAFRAQAARLWAAGLQAGIDVARLEIQRLRASGMSSGYPVRPKQVWQLQPTASFGTPSLTPPWAQRGCPRPAHRAQRRTGRRQWERKGSGSAALHAGTAARRTSQRATRLPWAPGGALLGFKKTS